LKRNDRIAFERRFSRAIVMGTNAKPHRRWFKRRFIAPVATAYHEAGHAVVAVVLAVPIEVVEIFPCGDGGQVQLRRASFPTYDLRRADDRAFVEHIVMGLFAGIFAETRWLRRCGYVHEANQTQAKALTGGSIYDMRKAADCLMSVCAAETYLPSFTANLPDSVLPDPLSGAVVTQAHFAAAWEGLEIKTSALLHAHWPAVRDVAAELLREQRLDGQKVVALVELHHGKEL
jgi:hypothetical protein